MQQNQSEGWVYILTNPSFNDLVKIGKTQRTPQERANELSKATGVPTPFRVFYTRFFEDCHQTEKDIHLYFATQRVANSDREFFRISPVEAVLILDRFFYEEKFKILENTIQAQQKEIQQLQKANELMPIMEEFIKDYQIKKECFEILAEIEKTKSAIRGAKMALDFTKDKNKIEKIQAKIEEAEHNLESLNDKMFDNKELRYINFKIETLNEYLVTLTNEDEKIYVKFEIDLLESKAIKQRKRKFLAEIKFLNPIYEKVPQEKKEIILKEIKMLKSFLEDENKDFFELRQKHLFVINFYMRALSNTKITSEKKEHYIKLLGYTNNFLYETYSPKNSSETETKQQIEWLEYELSNINDLERKTILTETIGILKTIRTFKINLGDEKEKLEYRMRALGRLIKYSDNPAMEAELELKIKALKLIIENWD